ncbi:YkvS family protein [Bacillus cereus]|nr:YkvS family protein [Bacillus cereus]
MEHNTKVTIGDYVQFSYRKNPNLPLTGVVLSVLQNTIVADITEIMEKEVDDVRQVVKHGYYSKMVPK